MVHADPNLISHSGVFAYHLNKPSTNRFLLVNGKQPKFLFLGRKLGILGHQFHAQIWRKIRSKLHARENALDNRFLLVNGKQPKFLFLGRKLGILGHQFHTQIWRKIRSKLHARENALATLHPNKEIFKLRNPQL